jgi:hypothetical protein
VDKKLIFAEKFTVLDKITALPHQRFEITPARNAQMYCKINNSLFGL